MIEAKDLRVGNLVYRKLSESDTEISKITGYDLWHFEFPTDDRHILERKSLSPIPLTAEILINNGFVNIIPDIYSLPISSTLIFQIDNMGDKYFLGVKNTAGYISLREVAYLHQIQNLYELLSDKELPIKL